MIVNWGISEFFGTIMFLPFIMYLTLMVFDGVGLYKDWFFTSSRRPRI